MKMRTISMFLLCIAISCLCSGCIPETATQGGDKSQSGSTASGTSKSIDDYKWAGKTTTYTVGSYSIKIPTPEGFAKLDKTVPSDDPKMSDVSMYLLPVDNMGDALLLWFNYLDEVVHYNSDFSLEEKDHTTYGGEKFPSSYYVTKRSELIVAYLTVAKVEGKYYISTVAFGP